MDCLFTHRAVWHARAPKNFLWLCDCFHSAFSGLVIFVLACEALLFLAHDTRAAEIIFDRDIRPLLAEKCFACHGPDAQEVKGDLRLDLQDSVLKKDGTGAIVPGDAKASELVRRVLSPDDGERMPPPDSHKTLTTAEIQSLQQWIEQGAIYSEHWAFLPTQRPVPPDVRTPHFIRNAIDSFVLAALEANGLQPSTQAEPETLMRRVSLDVRGLPPTLAELDEYLQDKQPDAYERMVERMLASPHYGEKMALLWMDLARYGDTSGYHLDSTRDSWPWRDWVIEAYNANMPFDRFSIEQLGGDLIPNSTLQQKIASGFNRNARFNEEGGADPDEWLVRYAIDRTTTLGRVWLGLTLNCAECHSHKYDPISQKEFYEIYAFFNSLEEEGAGGEGGFHNKPVPPVIAVPTRQHLQLEKELLECEQQLQAQGQETPARDPEIARVGAARAGELREKLGASSARLPLQMISVEMPASRPAFVLLRGDFQNRGEPVQRSVPAILPPLPVAGQRDRLALAKWLFDPRHPLTARVTVNRLWAQLLGRGIVETVGDFGRVGRYPTHPKLLDWLAVEFIESGWDTKHVLRLILHSAAYRQASINHHRNDEVDPHNQYLSRAPRYRLMAEEIRDGALHTAGLLNEEIGGPPVFPPQPQNYYAGKSGWKWDVSVGEAAHRRGLYTFWRRTTLYPTFVIFDAPDRSECSVQRPRTNTPLQALATLNDPQFVEAAKAFALRVWSDAPADLDGKLTTAFRRATARLPDSPELDVLRVLYEQRLEHYRSHPEEAAALTDFHPLANKPADAATLAAWVNVTNTILNLDECIVRE